MSYADSLLHADMNALAIVEKAALVDHPDAAVSANLKTVALQRSCTVDATPEATAACAQHLFNYGSPLFAVKEAYRVRRQERYEHINDDALRTAAQSTQSDRLSALTMGRVVHLFNDPDQQEKLDGFLPDDISASHLELPFSSQRRKTEPTTDDYVNFARQHLGEPHVLIVVFADGHIERDAVALSRISNSPLLIIHLDMVPRTRKGNRKLPFVPTGDHSAFPPVAWVRYALNESEPLAAWDVSTGLPIRTATRRALLADAVAHLLVRQLVLHDLGYFSLVPYESEHEQPSPPSHGFNHDRISVRKYGITEGELFATLLEHYWTLSHQTQQDRCLQSRLEFAAATLPLKQRAIVFDAAMMLEHESFMDQIRLRRMWVANEFKNVGRYAAWTNRELDDESARIVAEAAAAEKLESLILAPPVAPAASAEDEHIVCILHASAPQQSGGYAIRAHGILSNLKAAGVNITAVTRPGFPDPDQAETSSDTVDNVEYLRLPGLRSYLYGEAQYMLESVSLYRKKFERLGATKVHVRSTYLISIPAIIAAHQLGLKVVYEVSGLWELVYAAGESRSSLHRRAPFGEYWESIAVQAADEVLTMNQPMSELLLERGADPKHMGLAPNAVDTNQFVPGPISAKKRPRLGYIGSIVRYENLELLVKATKKLVDLGVDFDVKIVGDGNFYARVQRLVKKLGLETIIDMPGRVPHEQVAKEYAQMDIMVYPRLSTTATDTVTPLKPFEALAMAKAVVVSDIPPLREIAGNNERALLFKSNSVNELAKVLRDLIENPARRAQLGKAGREWVEQERSWSTVVDAFTDAYAKL